MAWQTDLLTMLRNVIFDVDDTDYTYTDNRLKEMLVVAARLVTQEIAFDTDYTVTISTTGISPDPTDSTDANSKAFENFIVLKAACLTDQSSLRTKALAAGVSARIGPAAITTNPSVRGFDLLMKEGPCATYEKLKWDYEMGDAKAIRAILSPFVGNTFDPRSLGGGTARGGKQPYRES